MSLDKAFAIVLCAPVVDADISVPLYPNDRYNEVLACKNRMVMTEKYLVWKLLEKVVTERLRLNFDNLKFTKTDNGQWVCPDLHFSLSHADGLLCVAVSDEPIGVDVEAVKRIRPEIEARILTDREREFIRSATGEERDKYLLESWVKKESIFKKNGGNQKRKKRNKVGKVRYF